MIDNSLAYLKSLTEILRWSDGLSSLQLARDVQSRAKIWGSAAALHIYDRVGVEILRYATRCDNCLVPTPPWPPANFCPGCGRMIPEGEQQRRIDDWIAAAKASGVEDESDEVPRDTDDLFPAYGIYIYYHSIEGYKIGKAENVMRRLLKHECSAPSLELLHVIESSDLGWAERFIHTRFAGRRRVSNHEYFDLTYSDLVWLFGTKVLDPPRMGDTDAQRSFLDLL